MKIRGICEKCGSNRWFVRKRSYVVEKISNKPITTNNEICGKCAKKLTKIVKLA